jgi:hypothetical protein
MATGRPTKYTQELADSICELTATSSRSLDSICKEVKIGVRTVLDWLCDDDKKDFAQKYARSKEEQADFLANEILEIADDGRNDLMTIGFGDKAYEAENKEVVNRSKLRVEARKWLAGKLRPKKYGDNLKLSGDIENPIAHTIVGMTIE